MATRRLNWGCGPRPAPGWIDSDLLVRPGIDVSGDIRDGLALGTVSEMLDRAGFDGVTTCRYRETASPWPEIVELDNRERESLFVEARN